MAKMKSERPCKRDGLIVYAVSDSVPGISSLICFALSMKLRAQSLMGVVDVPAIKTLLPASNGWGRSGNFGPPDTWWFGESANGKCAGKRAGAAVS